MLFHQRDHSIHAAGCSQCGQHTDPYFDWKNSSTAVIPDCKGKPCVLSQSYSEGSSWRAFKVVDQVYVGALEKQLMPSASSYNVPFEFGCQTSETGLLAKIFEFCLLRDCI